MDLLALRTWRELRATAGAYHLRFLEPDAGTKIRAALLGPLRWLGMGSLNEAAVHINALDWPVVQAARLHLYPYAVGTEGS